jgi:hypothetical protein
VHGELPFFAWGQKVTVLDLVRVAHLNSWTPNIPLRWQTKGEQAHGIVALLRLSVKNEKVFVQKRGWKWPIHSFGKGRWDSARERRPELAIPQRKAGWMLPGLAVTAVPPACPRRFPALEKRLAADLG